jgi:nitric oxide reductase NorD protein
MSDADSSAVELEPLRGMLRLYCRALSERGVELQDLTQLIDKNIGWSHADMATSDGAAIFLPAVIDRFDAETDNYDFLKVMLTQQAGHIEFGSFDFVFHRPSTLFRDLRPALARQDERNSQDHHHRHEHDETALPELTRLFSLFPTKSLARDIFSVFESARIEARVMREYPGIAPAYHAMRERVLNARQAIMFLPAREALLEYLIRVSLGQAGGIAVPAGHVEAAAQLGRWLRALLAKHATVEDTAEASLRAYQLLARVRNEPLDANRFTIIEEPERFKNSSAWGDEALYDPPLPLPRGDGRGAGERFMLPSVAGRERDYLGPQSVDYRGEFQPELAQLLSRPRPNSREQRKSLTAEELAELLRNQRQPTRRGSEQEGEEQDAETRRMVQNLMRELDRRDPRMQSVDKKPWLQADEDSGPLTATQPNTYIYDEWDVLAGRYRARWCKVHEKVMALGDLSFYRETLLNYAGLLQQIRREFEQVAPEIYHKEKRLPDGSDHDLDAAIEALTDFRLGISPSEKIFWRQRKNERDVAVAFLLDMSGSTGEAIASADDPGQRSGRSERSQRRIIDVEKEAIVLMSDALETIGDRYAVYGFSGHGRDNVEFYAIKEFDENFSPDVAKRLGRAGPLHATRMGPAIRHATSKLRLQQTRARFLFLISDGRPQDRGYSQESSEKSYAVQDTRMALMEARREAITPFCLTVDREGNDYLRAMMDDFSYEVLADVTLLPRRLPQLYKRLTF